MIRRVTIRRDARQDLRDATRWYRNISPDLAADFVGRVDDAIALAREQPLAFPVVHRTFRRVLLHQFPYALFYHADERRLIVVAVLHQARDPETLESRRA
jgi:plasmid stabilization system protein ParE